MKKVLILGAHLDDSIIAMGGTIRKMTNAGIEVNVFCFGNGRHVWDNLISNAVKFSPQGGTVSVSLKAADEKIIFTIDDQGEGISEDSKKHIFDKFYQGDSSHKQEGNGLGLALVKRILMITGGEIYAENLPEGGCRFSVILYD